MSPEAELSQIYGELMRQVDRLKAVYGTKAGASAGAIRIAKRTVELAAQNVLEARDALKRSRPK